MSGELQPPVRLWRIEHPADGLGPFQTTGLDQLGRPAVPACTPRGTHWLDAEQTGERHPLAMPLPESSPPLRWGVLGVFNRREAYTARATHLKFAFPSARALRTWFPVWAIHRLSEMGYQVLVVRAPWEAHTRWPEQARYDATKATVLRRLNPVDLLA